VVAIPRLPAAPTPAQLAQLPPAAAKPVDYAADIQPILERSCFQCHGPEKQKSGFRLDRRADALAGGDNSAHDIVPQRSADSPLIHAVAALDEDFVMPEKGDRLTAAEIGLLRAWIDQGAVMPEGVSADQPSSNKVPWSFQPLVRPAVPAAPPGAVPRAPVDAFVVDKLTREKLALSPEADRRTLYRRLSLVLLGLPPTPEDVEAFIKDPDPLAYEHLVDRLLASPHFGEQWAQHWLDVVRFAETNGSESNLYRRNAWAYRDYVIGAFNRDLPLDRFLQEQIAGDFLGVDEATTFLVSGLFVPPDTVGQEEQAIRQARADQLEETIQSVSAAALGVTMGCARCHNHKFDPITQKDYYSLAAVFQGLQYDFRPWRTQPEAAAHDARAAQLREALERQRAELRATNSPWTEEWPSHLETHFPAVTTRALRVELPAAFAGPIDEFEIYGAATGDRNLALAAHGAKARSGKSKEDPARPVSNLIDGLRDHYHNWRAREADAAAAPAWFEIELPAEAMVDHIAISADRGTLETTDYLTEKPGAGPRKFRLSARTAAGEWREIAAVDVTAGDARPGVARIRQLARDYTAELPPPIFAGRFAPPGPTHILGRGDPMSPREEVAPAAPAALHGDLGLTAQASDQARRLAFAEWVTSPDRDPLTPRVLANRLWLHVFGKGLVDTPSDFGNVGAPPTNPALLDWLASELVADGWSAKKIVRLLVCSGAFRQASAPNAGAAAIDADARDLWRFPPRRIEAETLRDSILLVAGTLDPKMGGPGFRIHADKKRFESWRVVDNAGPTTWRRMIYEERMRGIDDQMFTAFDRPDCGQVVPKRTASTTPLQALNLLDGPFVLGQAEQLAARVGREAGPDPTAQVARVFALAFCRSPSPRELQAARALVGSDGLPALCRALFNANEFSTIE